MAALSPLLSDLGQNHDPLTLDFIIIHMIALFQRSHRIVLCMNHGKRREKSLYWFVLRESIRRSQKDTL